MLVEEIKALIIDVLDLEDLATEDIDAAAPLFAEGLGLDSIDALELGVALQKHYGFELDVEMEDMRKHFFSVNSLAEFIEAGCGSC
jgi:acyl carrier protein